MAVTTSLSSGTLTITGDAAADDIAIVGTGNPGEITITGRPGTTVNGTSSVTIPGVTDDLEVVFHGGNDVIAIDNVYLAGDLSVYATNGNKHVTLGALHPVSTVGNLTVRTGPDNDVIQIDTTTYNVFVVGTLEVNAGFGFDTTTLYGASSRTAVEVYASGTLRATGITSGGNLRMRGWGEVDVRISAASGVFDISAAGSSRIVLDTNYSAMYIEVNFSAENSAVTIARCQTRQLNVYGSGYTNVLPVSTNVITIHGNYIVGPPYDFSHTHTVSLYVNFLGGGLGTDNHHDIVDVRYNVVHQDFFALLAAGDDTLTMVGNQVGQGAYLDGGSGFNRLSLGYNAGSLSAVNFV